MVSYSGSVVRFICICLGLNLIGVGRGESAGLFNTGVGADGNPLASGMADPHFSLVAAPNPIYNTAYASDSLPGNFLANSSASKWIGPSSDLNTSVLAGPYVYRTTFDLTGVPLNSIALVGKGAADDEVAIWLNGIYSHVLLTAGPGSLEQFTLNNGFVDGVNTLDFRMMNSTFSPTALRMEMSLTQVPEPSTYALVALGLGLFYFPRSKMTRR